MKNPRALFALLLLAVLALTGCARVTAGSGEEAGVSGGGTGGVSAGSDGAAAASPPARIGRGGQDDAPPLPAPEDGPGLQGPREGSGGAGLEDGFGLPLPLPVLLVLAAGILLTAAGVVLYLSRRNRGTAPAGPWQGGPAPAAVPPTGPIPAGAVPHTGPIPPGAVPATSPVPPAAPAAVPPTGPIPPGAVPTASPAPPAAPATAGPPASAPPAAGSPASAPPAAGPSEADPSGADPLADALTEVARSGISSALTQRVERLFADGHPGRQALIDACIDCRDQIEERHPNLSGLLLDGLNRAGVREIVADGEHFDPRRHEAFGAEPTDRPELHDTVAETVKRGYADGDHVIRVPQVAVYRHGPSGSGATGVAQ
ncbi:nucleotide exchange factor GrpE [Planomonospora corallina]|uniref:Nucleotide exchange factor GrpE n=1 Tax=Planomonospora corallina TaxID=1806052 RepID=A0ABV8ICX3_9ACTN